jgi:integrase
MTKHEASAPLTQKAIDAIKPGTTQVHYPDGFLRGLALRVSPGGAMSWVLVKRLPEGVKRILLGRYTGHSAPVATVDRSQFPAGYQSLTLKQAREEAARVLAMIAEGRSPAKEKALAQHVRAVDAQRGSFADLLEEYIAHRAEGTASRAAVGARQLYDWRRTLANLKAQAPALLAANARDIQGMHIVSLLAPIYGRGTERPKTGRGSKGRRSKGGAPGAAAKVQSFLRAAFAYGSGAELSVARAARAFGAPLPDSAEPATVKAYGLTLNPVANIQREEKSKAGTRALSAAELRQFWWSIDQLPATEVSPAVASLLRFAIASGGQRAHQLAREPWQSYDTGKGLVTLTDRKGRGGVVRAHLVPMTSRMAGILKAVRNSSDHAKESRPASTKDAAKSASNYPWANSKGEPIRVDAPAKAIRHWLASEHAFIDGVPIAPFMPRDLRRTCTQLMQAAGVPDIEADRLQSHGVAGVVRAHYRNNPEPYLPEKKRALDKFDALLGNILIGKSIT